MHTVTLLLGVGPSLTGGDGTFLPGLWVDSTTKCLGGWKGTAVRRQSSSSWSASWILTRLLASLPNPSSPRRSQESAPSFRTSHQIMIHPDNAPAFLEERPLPQSKLHAQSHVNAYLLTNTYGIVAQPSHDLAMRGPTPEEWCDRKFVKACG